jgi:hypothetical protein
MPTAKLEISQTWDGEPIGTDERVALGLHWAAEGLEIQVDAPFHGDPPPRAAAGSLDGLWEWEVVELFLLGGEEHYLEIELGPHGHYLTLHMQGSRQLIEKGMPIEYQAVREGARWRGVARIPAALLPEPVERANAYAIHGIGAHRRYLALHPVPGPEPDFHRLELFRPLAASGSPGDTIE